MWNKNLIFCWFSRKLKNVLNVTIMGKLYINVQLVSEVYFGWWWCFVKSNICGTWIYFTSQYWFVIFLWNMKTGYYKRSTSEDAFFCGTKNFNTNKSSKILTSILKKKKMFVCLFYIHSKHVFSNMYMCSATNLNIFEVD